MFRPEFAALAMAFSSVTVISLSLMLKRYVPPIKRSSNYFFVYLINHYFKFYACFEIHIFIKKIKNVE